MYQPFQRGYAKLHASRRLAWKLMGRPTEHPTGAAARDELQTFLHIEILSRIYGASRAVELLRNHSYRVLLRVLIFSRIILPFQHPSQYIQAFQPYDLAFWNPSATSSRRMIT